MLDVITNNTRSFTQATLGIRETFGKPVDIFSLKVREQRGYLEKALRYHRQTSEMFAGKEVARSNCPICSGRCTHTPIAEFHAGKYLQCHSCTHVFTGNGLTGAELEQHYKNSIQYATTYTSPETAQIRVNQVATPKAKWLLNAYGNNIIDSMSKPSILDVGAGGGHFVKACLDLGYFAQGIELSLASIDFAQKVLGVKLHNQDFLKATTDELSNPDIISFWGVIEHVADPNSLLDHARKILQAKDHGMIVASVPNFRSGSTIVQMMYPDTALRHLDPVNHGNIFTQESLLTAFNQANIAPTHSWYFGMDAYELWTQLITCGRIEDPNFNEKKFMETFTNTADSLNINGDVPRVVAEFINKLMELRKSLDYHEALTFIPEIQAAFDNERASDEIVFAGTPLLS